MAKAVVTPRESMWMAGYASRDKPAEGKLHDLWAKALVLEDGAGRRGLVVTLDLIGLSRPIYERIATRLEERLELDRSRILLLSSHTHCGPVLANNLESLYPLDAAGLKLVADYTRRLEETVVAIAERAARSLAPVVLEAGEGICRFAVNRRNNREGEVPRLRQSGSLEGPVDHRVPVLVVKSAEGKRPVAVVFGYACHNTTLSFFQWCGDYAGFAQIDLERQFPGAQAMFFAGCGGDQNPLPRRTVELCEGYGRELAAAVADVVRSGPKPLSAALETAFTLVPLALGPPPSMKELEGLSMRNDYQGRWAKRVQNQLRTRPMDRQDYPYPIVVWRLGGKQWWVALGGEVVVDYALRFQRELGGDVWIAGYANDVMAYIPSLRVLREGGYEGSTSMMGYGLPTLRWGDPIEERIVGAVHGLFEAIDGKRGNGPRRSDGPAAVDEESLPGHHPGVQGEKDRDLGDVLGR